MDEQNKQFDKKNLVIFLLIVVVVLLVFSGKSSKDSNVEYLPPFSFTEVPGLVVARGVWTAKGEDLANKYNSASISCFNAYGRDISFDEIRSAGVDPNGIEMYCYIAQADIIGGYLSADLQLFDITDWNKSSITAETSGICRKTIMVLDRVAQTVTQTGTLIDNTGLCEGLSSDPIQSYLADGLDVLK